MVSSYRAIRENSNSVNPEIWKSSSNTTCWLWMSVKSIIWTRKWVVSGWWCPCIYTRAQDTTMQMCLPDTQVQGRQSPCQLWEARRVREGGVQRLWCCVFLVKKYIYIKPPIYHFSQLRGINYIRIVVWPSPPPSPELSHLPNWNPISIYTNSSSASFQLFLMLRNY